jgi:hypothetical protein
MTVKERYAGIQSVFYNANKYSCLFLCLLSIAEEASWQAVDLIGVYRHCIKKHWIDDDFTCLNQTAILEYITGKHWRREVRKSLPDPVPDEMYTVEKWYNPRTGFTHFKRRGFDTLYSSNTVKEGKLKEYYCYIMED